jgi:hypothetical protein
MKVYFLPFPPTASSVMRHRRAHTRMYPQVKQVFRLDFIKIAVFLDHLTFDLAELRLP